MLHFAITLIGICLNVIFGCSNPTYQVGQEVTVNVKPAYTQVQINLEKHDVYTVTLMLDDTDNDLQYTTVMTYTAYNTNAHFVTGFIDSIEKMTIRGKVSVGIGNMYKLDNVDIVAPPSMLDKAGNAVSSAYTYLKGKVSNASNATKIAGVKLADGLVYLVNSVKP